MKFINSLIVLCSLFGFFMMGCQAGPDQTNIELIQDMMRGPQINAQEGGDDGEMLNRRPPEQSVSREYAPYPFGKSDVKSANTLKSPLPTLTKEEILDLNNVGKTKYQIYCGICHGNQGLGNGSIADKMLKRPPNIVDKTYRSYSDGRLFHVVTNGWGLMGGYASQVPEENERWAIVDHIRSLQEKQISKEGQE